MEEVDVMTGTVPGQAKRRPPRRHPHFSSFEPLFPALLDPSHSCRGAVRSNLCLVSGSASAASPEQPHVEDQGGVGSLPVLSDAPVLKFDVMDASFGKRRGPSLKPPVNQRRSAVFTT